MLALQQRHGATHRSKRNGAYRAALDFFACVPRKIKSAEKGVELLSFKISESSFSKYFQTLDYFFSLAQKKRSTRESNDNLLKLN